MGISIGKASLRRGLSVYPERVNKLRTLGVAALLSGLVLLTATGQAQPAAPHSRLSLLRQAGEEIAAHHLSEAQRLLAAVLAEDPKEARAQELMGVIRFEQGDAVGAETLFRSAIENNPALASAHANLGSLLESTGRPDEARSEYEQSLHLDPVQPQAARGVASVSEQQALVLAQSGQTGQALTLLEHARTLAPSDPELAYDLGALAMNARQYDLAAETLETARSLAPSDPRAVYALARVRLAQQRMPESEKLFRLYLTMRPEDATAHFGLGHLLAMLLRSDEARAEFERSIQLAPAQTESYVELADLDVTSARYPQAVEAYRKVLLRAPEHPGALTGLGNAYYRQHDFAQAEPVLAHAVQVAPQSSTAHYLYGLTLKRLGQETASQQELDTAASLGHQESLPPPR
ncbi:MAG: tetratricopeptide repeat protein [Acidobacteriota bacterium]|nr:tetratricopeptide repeat protein [Acidobacteriota bacterium]